MDAISLTVRFGTELRRRGCAADRSERGESWAMSETMVRDEALDKIWSLIKEARSALLVTVTKDGSLDSRPMGCVQRAFDGKLWFLAFASSPKITEIEHNSHVLVAYSRPSEFEYVSLSGRARIIEDKRKV